jgi:hypothetical protein
MKFKLSKSLLLAGALCTAGVAQEAISGIQAPYSQPSAQVQGTQPNSRTNSRLHSSGPASSVEGLVQEGKTGTQQPPARSVLKQRSSTPAHGASQLCFQPGKGYVLRTGESCSPTGAPSSAEATAGQQHPTATSGANARADANTPSKTHGVNPALMTATDTPEAQEGKKSTASRSKRPSRRQLDKSGTQGLCDDNNTQNRSRLEDQNRSALGDKRKDEQPCATEKSEQDSHSDRKRGHAMSSRQ